MLSAIFYDQSKNTQASTAGAIPGIVAFIIVEVGAWFMIFTMIIRAVRRGETFDYGNMEAVPDFEGNKKLPNFIVALLPLILVFVLYTIVGSVVATLLLIAFPGLA